MNNFLSRFKSFIPIFQWLPAYKKNFFIYDIIAGITLASFVLPESIAYATIAGVPGQYGIYCCLAGGLFYALFTTTKQVAVGPTSAISLMIGTTVSVLSEGNLDRWISIAELTALAVMILCLIAFIFRLSALVNFISHNVLLGFKAGAAFTIAASQLPKLFGIEGGGTNFFFKMGKLFVNLPETNINVLMFGIVALILLIAGNKFLPGKPVSLLLVIISILAVTYSGLSELGLHVAGLLPEGLPSIGRPSLKFKDVDGVFGLALGCFLMGYIETIAVSRTFAEKNKYKIEPRQELLALGMANFASAFANGFVVSGGLSQSTVNDKAGARTPLSLILCSAFLAIILLFFTGLLENLPEVILAVIVIVAVSGLVKVKELKLLYELSRTEFTIAMVAFGGVLVFGILKGVLIASFISILVFIARAAHPTIAVLGRIPGTKMFSDISRHPDNEQISTCLILRIESSLLYFNEESVYNRIMQIINNASVPFQLVVLDLSATPNMDVPGSRMILNLSQELKERNIDLKIVDALSEIRMLLRKQGFENLTGGLDRKISLDDVLTNFTQINQ
jgi:SulP family sulfate permease